MYGSPKIHSIEHNDKRFDLSDSMQPIDGFQITLCH